MRVLAEFCRHGCRTIRNQLILCVLTVVLGGILVSAPARADMQSFYDPAGRLTGVLDPANGSAQYNYDAAGNILSIVRQPLSALVVLQFSPATGGVGAAVTISGTGFDTSSDTTVNFNGIAASPTAVSSTQITVPVPTGATTGPITVTSPAGTVTTTASFTVGTPNAPTISGFSPSSATVGSSVTISGTNFSTTASKPYINGRLFSTLTSETATAVAGTVPAASSGHVSVATPNGTATTSGDFIIPPAGYSPSQVAATVRGSIGSPISLSAAPGGEVSLALFDGTAGERVNMVLQQPAPSYCVAITVLAPDGTAAFSNYPVCSGTWFSGAFTLPTTGTYTLEIPSAGTAGTITANIFDMPANVSQSTTIDGGSSAITIADPGQLAVYTFTASAGAQVGFLLDISGLNYSYCSNFAIQNPDGTNLNNTLICGNTTFPVSPAKLNQTGTYTVTFTPSLSGSGSPMTWGTGTVNLSVFTVPPPATTNAPLDGGAASVTVTAPTQQAAFTFSGTAGQRAGFYLDISGLNYGSCSGVALKNPDGSTLYSNSICGNGFFASPILLSQTGTQTLLFTPSVSGSGSPMTWGTGTVKLWPFSIPDTATNTITVGGPTASDSVTAPFQQASFTFSGISGQTVAFLLDISGMNYSYCSYASIQAPNGSSLYGSYICGNYTFPISPTTLSQTGTYTINFSPSVSGSGAPTSWGTGAVNMTVFLVPAAATNTVSIGGPTSDVTISTPFQQGSFTFTGTSGQNVNLALGFPSTAACNQIWVYNPDGSALINGSSTCSSNYDPTLALTQTGTFTILIVPIVTWGGSGPPTTWGTGTFAATLSLSS